MNSSLPVVSIIMPMRNTEAYVLQAVNSILGQDFTDLELIVVDDGSTDRSRSLIETVSSQDKRLHILTGNNQGIAAAKNLGLEQAKGEIVMFCDADDYFSDGRIARQKTWLDAHPEAGAICGSYIMVDSHGGNSATLSTGTEECEVTEELLSGKTRTHLCTFAVRSQFTRSSNRFRDFFVSAEDIDFQLRLAETCRVFYSPSLDYHYRLHGNSITHRQASNKRKFYEEMARAFNRQRRESGQDDLQKGAPPPLPIDEDGASSANAQLQGILMGNSWQLFEKGKKREALSKGFAACKINLANMTAWKNLLMLILKSLKI